MWYKRIYKYLRLFLIIYPLFYWFFIVRALCEDGWCYADSDFIPSMAKFFAITYIIGIIVILGLFWIYTLFLLWNKILYKIKQFIKKIKTFLKIKKKKIWKYPIIIQYSSPKWLTPMEVSYLYNFRHFKWNISCLFYKWAIEKRVSINFKKWNILSFDKVEIKIIDNHVEDMCEDEQFQWNLIFGNDKEIELPNINILKTIPKINIQTAKICLDKELIEEKISINLTEKNIEWIFACFCILSVLSFIWYSRIFLSLQDKIWKLANLIFMWLLALTVISLFWCIIWKIVFHDTKLTYYKLSEIWKEVLAEIYGYKYFLEACDEKKIKTFLEQDPEYLDKIMPYAIALWVETEIIKNISPKILDWINNNRYVWDLYSTAKTMTTSSERTILFPTEKGWKKRTKKTTKKIKKDNKENTSHQKTAKIKF